MLRGRTAAIAELRERVEQRRPVAVHGEAGVGKTTLLRAATTDLHVFEGGGLSTLHRLPYLALRRALGRELRGDAAYVAREVADEVGEGVLLLDDLHWADEDTLLVTRALAGRIRLAAGVRRGDPRADATLTTLAGWGFELVAVEPLDVEDAADLVRDANPELPDDAVARIVERGGGNPLVLHELARTVEPTPSLRLAVAARLTHVSAAAREAMALLAVAGDAVEDDLVGDAADELVLAGLARRERGGVTAAHALLAEAALADVDDASRRALHSRLARSVAAPGDAARHHAAAGELEDARRKASLAAKRTDDPVERATYLELEAACTPGADGDRFRLRAAWTLLYGGRWDRAHALLEHVDAFGDAEAQAELVYIRWLNDALRRPMPLPEERARAIDDALEPLRGRETPIEVRLRLAQVVNRINSGEEPRAIAAHADETLAFAHARGAHLARAYEVVGKTRMFAALPGWEEALRTSLELARADADFETETVAVEDLTAVLALDGRVAEAYALTEEAAGRAHELRLSAPEFRYRAWNAARAGWLEPPARALAHADALLAEPIEEDVLPAVEDARRHALIDLGRLDVVVDELARPHDARAPLPRPLGGELVVRAELALAAGRPHDAIAATDEYLTRWPDFTDFVDIVHVLRMWARFEAGADVGPAVTLSPWRLFASGEGDALVLLAGGRHAEAADAFAVSAEHWHGRHFRHEQRCRWARAEALRRAGDARSVVELEQLESFATEHELRPLLVRIRRSLRLAGVRRTSERSRVGDLTGREHEILELVASGFTNAEIARRLGLGTSAVARMIESASSKLGARSRAHAAAIASDR